MTTRAEDKALLRPPEGIGTCLYWVCLAGPVLLALSMGLQLTLTLVMALGPLAQSQWPPVDTLTEMGRIYVHPSYDVKAYVAGCVITLGLTVLSLWAWNRKLRSFAFLERQRRTVWGCVFQVSLALAGLFVFLAASEIVRRLVFRRWALNAGELLVLLAPLTVTILLAVLYYLREQVVARALAFEDRLRWGWDVAVPLLICLAVFVPDISRLAGAIYANEGFFHWDHFVMAPATAFSHGKAFGTDFYAQYGVGWPLFFAYLAPLLRLSYEHTLQVSVCYACLYFIGMYVLLRVVTRHAVFSATGVGLALFLSVYAPVWHANGLCAIWQWPSSSILRSAMDVWFLLCIAMHLRSRRMGWMLGAGCAVGLGVLLETDTGLCLAISLVLYGLCLLLLPDETSQRKRMGTLAAAWLCAALVCLAGFTAASRMTLFTSPGAFWSGWLEGVTNSAQLGIGGLYLLSRIGIWDLVFFTAMTLVCFTAFIALVVRFLHGRLSPNAIFIGCVGAFGLMRSTVFVWRSLTGNLTHMAIPFAIIIAVSAAWGCRWLAQRLEQDKESPGTYAIYLAVLQAPYIALLAAALLIWFSPTFHEYPGTLRYMAKGPQEKGLCLLDAPEAICGLPEELAGDVQGVREAIEKMGALRKEGSAMAVLDDRNTLYYLEAGAAPWGRDPTIFLNTFTIAQCETLKEELLAKGPEYVFIRPEPPAPYFTTTWQALHDALPQAYVQGGMSGPFELWRRK